MATPPSQQPSNSSELQLYRVLQRANLLQYYDTFISQGGDDVQQLCEAGEDEFLEIMALVGMASKPLHVRRLQKALQAWVVNPAAFEGNGNVRKAFPTHVHSMTGHTSQGLGHASQSIGPAPQSASPTHTPVSDRPQQGSVQPDSKVTPPQSSTISTSTPWSSSLSTAPGGASPSEHSNREQPSPTDSQEEEFKDLMFPSDPGQSYSGGALTGSPFGQPVLLEHQITAIATAAALLAQELPSVEPKSLPKKQISKEINMVMSMSSDDPMQMDALRKYAAIYGRFDSKRKNDRPMSLHEISVNEAAAQLCSHFPALLTRREELFPLARQVVRDSGYQYSKGHSRAAEIVPTKIEPSSDLSPDTALTPSSPLSSVGTSAAAPVSPLEDKLTKTQNDLTDVTSNLSELSKEQDRIRSALRVLLEAKDHTQMSALTAEMDTINDRYARLTTRRQQLVGQLASLRRQSPKLSGASVMGNSGHVPGNFKLNEKNSKLVGDKGIDNNNVDNNTYNANNDTPNRNNIMSFSPSSNNSLNALYMAAALQSTNEGSLIEEGLRIATQYGMADFAQELIGMKNFQQSDSGESNEDKKPKTLGEKNSRNVNRDKQNVLVCSDGGNMFLTNSQPSLSARSSPLSSSSSSSPSSSSSIPSSSKSFSRVHPAPTTINIVAGVGFQQYANSAATTTQKLQSLDTIRSSKMAASVTKAMPGKDTKQKLLNSSGNCPTTANTHIPFLPFSSEVNNSSSNQNNINNQNNKSTNNEDASDDKNSTFTNSFATTTSTTSSSTATTTPNAAVNKPVEVEMTRRSNRKRNSDPDYYLINGGEKRFRSHSSRRRSGSNSSERNVKVTPITPSTSTAPSPSPSSSTPSPSPSSSASLGKSQITTCESPSPTKANGMSITSDDSPSSHVIEASRTTSTTITDAAMVASDSVEIGTERLCGDANDIGEDRETNKNVNGEDSGISDSVEDWVPSGDASLVPDESGAGEAGTGVLDESGEEGERRVGRRKRNQPVVSYTAFR